MIYNIYILLYILCILLYMIEEYGGKIQNNSIAMTVKTSNYVH